MIGFLMQDMHVNKMVMTNIRYIPLNVGQVGHFWTPKIYCNPSDHGGTLNGSQHFVHIFKVVNNVGYMVYLIIFKLRSSNRTQLCHGKEREGYPPMQEP
jgi:hypothetical protein